MIHNQSQKIISLLAPAAALEGGSATIAPFDTAGFDYCTIYVQLGVVDCALTALKVQEDNTLTEGALTSAADITGLILGTSTDIDGTVSALPDETESAFDGLVYAFDIDLRGRKRYLDLVITAEVSEESAGVFVTAFAVLSRAEQAPVTSAQRGCEHVLRV